MINFIVPGEPVAKARARTVRAKNGKTHSYTPAKTVSYEHQIAITAKSEMSKSGLKMSTCPIRLDIDICFKPPESWPKWKRHAALSDQIAHTSKPDLDNVAKSIKDALNGIVYADDSQVIEILASKGWDEEPHILVRVVELVDVTLSAITQRGQLKRVAA